MRYTRFFVFAILAVVCLGLPRPASAQDDPRYTALFQKADTQGTVRVIVSLNVPFSGATRQSVTNAQAAISQARASVLATIAASGGKQTSQNWSIPYMGVEVSRAGLEALIKQNVVNDIDEDLRGTHTDNGSNGLINTSGAWAKGYHGGGMKVAVIDSGVDRTHPFLSGRVTLEACFSTTDQFSQTLCPNGATTQTGTGAAQPCFIFSSGCEHGTHVAGIAAGYGTYSGGVGYDGVATTAEIFAIDMFYRDIASGNAYYYTVNLIDALNHVYNTSPGQNIAAINMSLGTFTQYTSVASCETAQSATKTAVDLLRTVNIVSIASSGNNANTTGTTAPACISSVIAVGAVNNSDVIQSFSNSASWLKFLAPGLNVNSSVPNSLYEPYSGTSMASPHVAGAWVLMRHMMPNASITQIQTALENTGVSITDSRNGVTSKRINIGAALTRLLPNRVKRIGVYRSGLFLLRQGANRGGGNNIYPVLFNGPTSNVWPVIGDWNGDGLDSLGVYDRSTGVFYLADSISIHHTIDYVFVLGNPNDLPIAGRWSLSATHDGAGVFRPTNGIIYLKNDLTTGFSDNYMVLGNPGDAPVAGDWDGDGVESPGVFRPNNATFYLSNQTNGVVFSDYDLQFGMGTDMPFAGDWEGYGHAGIGIFRDNTFALRNTLTTGPADIYPGLLGTNGDIPIAGRWEAETLYAPPLQANPFLNARILVNGQQPPAANTNTDGSAD